MTPDTYLNNDTFNMILNHAILFSSEYTMSSDMNREHLALYHFVWSIQHGYT